MNVATTCRDIKELIPVAQTACNLFIAECKKKGIPIFITETYRSQDRQDYLYAQGRTREGNVVTWTRSSRHTIRRAWDIACTGNILYDVNILKRAGEVAKSLGITWGGTWDKPDMPHFEISTGWINPNDIYSRGPVGEPGTPGVIPPKKEDEEMIERCDTIDEVPNYARATVEKLIKKGAFADVKKLNLSDDMLRIFVINDRLGLYK